MKMMMQSERVIEGDMSNYVDTFEVHSTTGGGGAVFSISEETVPHGSGSGGKYKIRSVVRALGNEETRELYNVLRTILESYDE